ncbi:MAG: hypothetical protein CMJ27_11200 [Phycisphaerae bacterium]|nr:hypothetical protein [Phycisphaerae bacterium]OUX00588.1 MAG: hypothetical protein CBD91_06375 [Phycisphaeraceae bacterium TMED231]
MSLIDGTRNTHPPEKTMTINRLTQTTVLLLSVALLGPALSAIATGTSTPALDADADAAEITAMILAHQAQSNRENRQVEGVISKHGSVEFWSSGGLRQHVENGAELPSYTNLNIIAKDIEIESIVPGQAAVATYYAEGSLQAKGGSPVSNYLTRVTVVFAKEGDAWKRRAAHWSPIIGGAGTTQTVLDKKN